MDDRIGQRLLRFFGALPEMPKDTIEGDCGKSKGHVAEAHGEAPVAPPRRLSEESTVERYQPNPFLGEGEAAAPRTLAREEPDARQLAEETPARIEERTTMAEKSEVPESAPREEKREVEETREADSGHQHEESEDGEGVGSGWIRESASEDESEASKGLRHAQALGDEARCHGMLGDGTRCLRKPVDGKAYCREHAAGPQSEMEAIASREAATEPDVQVYEGTGVKVIE